MAASARCYAGPKHVINLKKLGKMWHWGKIIFGKWVDTEYGRAKIRSEMILLLATHPFHFAVDHVRHMANLDMI